MKVKYCYLLSSKKKYQQKKNKKKTPLHDYLIVEKYKYSIYSIMFIFSINNFNVLIDRYHQDFCHCINLFYQTLVTMKNCISLKNNAAP